MAVVVFQGHHAELLFEDEHVVVLVFVRACVVAALDVLLAWGLVLKLIR